jgi:hypothetical protein
MTKEAAAEAADLLSSFKAAEMTTAAETDAATVEAE